MTINLSNSLRILRSGLEYLSRRMRVLSGPLLNRVNNQPAAREVGERLSEQDNSPPVSSRSLDPPLITGVPVDPFTSLALEQAEEDRQERERTIWDDGVWHRQVPQELPDE